MSFLLAEIKYPTCKTKEKNVYCNSLFVEVILNWSYSFGAKEGWFSRRASQSRNSSWRAEGSNQKISKVVTASFCPLTFYIFYAVLNLLISAVYTRVGHLNSSITH